MLHPGRDSSPASSSRDAAGVSDHETRPTKINALVRFYPAAIVTGVAFLAISLWAFEGWHKITGAFWAGLVLFWTQQYRRYRASTQG